MRKSFISILLTFFVPFANAQSPAVYDRSTVIEFFQNQEFEKAIAYLKTIPQPAGIQYDMDMGYANFSIGHYLYAIPYYKNIYEKYPDNYLANLYLAQSYNLRKEFDSALFYYKNLTVLRPEHVLHWLNTVTLFSRLREADSALHYSAQSYAIHSTSGSIVTQYAKLLIAKKQQEKARKIIDDFLKSDSSDTDVIAQKIEMSFKTDQHKEVIFWGEKLLRAAAEAPVAYTRLAYSYLNTKQIDKSLWLCNKMIDENIVGESILYCAALCQAAKKNYDASNELLDKCLEQNLLKDAIIYLRAKAGNYAAVKNFSKAASYYDTSYYIFHKPIDLYLAGSVYDENLKNKSKASSYYKKFVSQTKSPANDVEVKLFKYIDAYLKQQ